MPSVDAVDAVRRVVRRRRLHACLGGREGQRESDGIFCAIACGKTARSSGNAAVLPTFPQNGAILDDAGTQRPQASIVYVVLFPLFDHHHTPVRRCLSCSPATEAHTAHRPPGLSQPEAGG
jgi:hypothetical protein